MQNGSDFYVAKFLVTAGYLNVCDVAHAADIAAAGNIEFSTALLKSNYVQPGQFSVAADAVKGMEQSTVGPQIAQVLFQTALQRGITFEQAFQEVETKRSCSVNDFVNPAPPSTAGDSSERAPGILSGASPRTTLSLILSRRRHSVVS